MDNFEETIVNPNIYIQRDEIYRHYEPVVSKKEKEQLSEERTTYTFIIGAIVAIAFAAVALISQGQL